MLEAVTLPEPEMPRQASAISEDLAWFLGLYLAEGSRSHDCVQISGHANEIHRVEKIRAIASTLGASVTFSVFGNNLSIRIYGRVLVAVIEDHVGGRTARDKGLKVRCWSYPNSWLKALLAGYLEGDGYWEESNSRWRIGFTRNYNLERDLRVLCARLGLTLSLKLSTATNQDGEFPSFRGEIRYTQSSHGNVRLRTEIVDIRKARCREVYDIGVEDDPHVFALASGVLTHNSKPNPMPESVTDRPTKSHEYIFLLSKSERYYYDAEAIAEPLKASTVDRYQSGWNGNEQRGYVSGPQNHFSKYMGSEKAKDATSRNARSVWSITTEPWREAHFAVFPTEIPRRCILAGSAPGDVVLDPFSGSGTTLKVAIELGRKAIGIELKEDYIRMIEKRCKTTIGLPLTFEGAA